MRSSLVLLAVLAAIAGGQERDLPEELEGLPWIPRQGRDRIGQEAPEFSGLTRLQGEGLTMAELRGKAILIRFWLISCPYCRNSAPSLNELHEKFSADGLVVIGIHHPKSRASRNLDNVRESFEEYGFRFPVAHDANWATLERYWFTGPERRFTSVSFLVARTGTIRFVHDGGEFHTHGGPEHETCHRAHEAVTAMVERVLSETED